jgi:uncharacterized protein
MHPHILFSLALALLAAEVPAIECAHAGNFAEKAICSDPVLTRLDTALNQNYRWMLNADIGNGARNALKHSQRTWVIQRNRCLDRECLVTLYKQRIEDICDYPVIGGVHPVCEEPDVLAGIPLLD